MYKGITKLAKLIKIMAKDVSKDSSWWKIEQIGPAIGFNETEDFFGEISVEDDSGYRSITIGDTRGNISRVNGRRIEREEHKGYMLLYSENCSYENDKRKWKYSCFPSQKEIENRLKKIVDKVPLIPMDKNNCDFDEFWYENRDDETLTYLSDTVKLYADTISKDKRTPEEIFAACE